MARKIPVPVTILKVDLEGHRTKALWPFPDINTSAVLHVNEDTLINTEEVRWLIITFAL